jgi:hypothetical protein
MGTGYSRRRSSTSVDVEKNRLNSGFGKLMDQLELLVIDFSGNVNADLHKLVPV